MPPLVHGAMPKSRILALPFAVTMIVSGRRSPWMMPWRVRVGDAVGDLHGEIERAPRVHRRAAAFVAQAAARGELVGEVVASVGLADVPQRGDVRMGQRGGGARVLEQARAAAPDRAAIAGATIFSATVRPTLVSRARNTSPMPPSPMRSSRL